MKKIAFIHPDLGIGGAERLIIDAALACQSFGHEVHLFTNHHDSTRCFKETIDGSLTISPVGEWLPRHIFGRCLAVCAYFRMIYAAIFLCFLSDFQPDVVVCDQVAACIPFLKIKKLRVIFYCHFPDQLLTDHKHWLKRLYRIPLDWLEEKSTGMADAILVNSYFTANIFKETFPSLRNKELKIIYPPININNLLKPFSKAETPVKTNATTVFLSLNRYERKKNISLAIKAMRYLKDILPENEFSKIHLIIAGGYDERVQENRDYYLELIQEVKDYNLLNFISFLKTPDDEEKKMLLHSCTAVLYTPENEHFGIVPLEAMLLGRPVLACNSGGPLETIMHEQTGYLCDPTPKAFAEKMACLAKDHSLARELGEFGIQHVHKMFSFQKFANQLNNILENDSN